MRTWPTTTYAMMLALLFTGCATPGVSSTEFAAPQATQFTSLDVRSGSDGEHGEPPQANASLDELLAHATRHHPRLRAEHARWEAQVSRTKAMGQWMDPMVGYTFAPLPIETRNGPIRHTVSVSQKVPWPGQTEARQREERAGADARARTFDASYIAIRLELEELYWSIWSIEKTITLLERELELLGVLERSLQARVEVGTRPASDLARLGLERARKADAIASLRARRQIEEAMLGQALGLPKSYAVTFPETLRPTNQPPEVDLEAIIDATPTPPHLAALSDEIERRRARQETIALQKRPTFEVGAQWSLIGGGGNVDASGEDHSQHAAGNPGRDAVMLRVGVTLPIWTKAIDARRDEAAASTLAASAELEQARHIWSARLRSSLTGARDAHRQIILIEGTLLTQARATFDMVRGDYEANATEFSALLEVIETTYMLEREVITQLARRERSISRYNALLGAPLSQTSEVAND